MIREICKYLRRFRWLIGAYVLWTVLTTFLTSTHQAFVHPSAGVRQFAWVMESYATIVSLLMLLPLVLFLGMEDNLWDSKAFWRLRPVRPRTLLAAKVVLLVLLAYVLPFVAVYLTSITAGVSLVGAFTSSLDHTLWVGLFASILSAVTLIAKKWSDLAMILALCVIGIGFHLACWTLVAESKPLAGRFHGVGGMLLALYAMWKAAQTTYHDGLALMVLGGYIVALPLATALVASFTTRSDLDQGFDVGKAESVLQASLSRSPGAHHIGDGLKLGYDLEASGALVLRYWYQSAQRSIRHLLNTRPNSTGKADQGTRSLFPHKVRVRLEVPLSHEQASDEVLVFVLRCGSIIEHRVR